MTQLFINIKELIGVETVPHPARAGQAVREEMVAGAGMKSLKTIKNAYLCIKNDRIADFGLMDELPAADVAATHTKDMSGATVLPAWCDSHTHIVYAGNREGEFEDRIRGLSYEEIAVRGGGILNSAEVLQRTDENELYDQSARRLEEVIRMGTGAIEIKSGYGLTLESEFKMLRVIRRLKENYPVAVKATFLGAHALPEKYKNDREGYLNSIVHEMIPYIAGEGLADYIDAFCETDYFTVAETALLMEVGEKYGLKPKIHVNQFSAIGGVKAAVEHGALSVDHLEVMAREDLQALQGSRTMPVALPGCSFFLGIPYTPAREIIDSGLPMALATDYNPGSAPSGNMNFVVAMACIKMKMTPEEAINAATLNGAYAMGLSKTHGSIAEGKTANLIFTKPIPSYSFLPYAFGSDHIDKVMINGQFI